MSEARQSQWQSVNKAYFTTELGRVREALVRYSARPKPEPSLAPLPDPPSGLPRVTPSDPQAPARRLELPPDLPAAPTLLAIAELFALSPFEVDVLLLCAGFECSDFSAVCGQTWPSFGLALAALADSHLSAAAPDEPLRRHRLVRVGADSTLLHSALRIDERILFYLLGLPATDEQLRRLLRPAAEPRPLTASQRLVLARARRLLPVRRRGELPLLWLCGPDSASRRDLAGALAGEYGLGLYELRASDIPRDVSGREELLALWSREVLLEPLALLLCYEDTETQETLQAAAAWLDRAAGVVLVTSRELCRAGERPPVRLDVPRPSQDEQLALWQEALGEAAAPLNGVLAQLASQFQLGPAAIAAAAAQALARPPEQELSQALWQSCCEESRPHLLELAQHLECHATFDDLVLPAAQEKSLRAMVAHSRHQALVYHGWGFAHPGARGLGITALFVGQSGTGKTLAAEVLARELGLQLYRIDLSQIVSKYIGETEKNMRRVFDAADQGGAVLLFDEADALFGKRSEVKDSHDRYANLEVSYLLQRMECYRGVSILTSNLRSALDTAFVRRLRFIIHFPFPDVKERRELWRRALPPAAPQSGLDLEKLARLSIAGGHIRNIALGAAFLAADEQQPLRMGHLLRSVRSEYAKLERPLNEAEVAGWG